MPRRPREMDGLPPTLGKRLRDLRKRHGLTQEQAALRVGLSVDGYRHWEHGRSSGVMMHLQSTAQAFGLTIPELLAQLGFIEPDALTQASTVDEVSLPLVHRWLLAHYPTDIVTAVIHTLEGADKYSEEESRWIAYTMQKSVEMIRRRPGQPDRMQIQPSTL